MPLHELTPEEVTAADLLFAELLGEREAAVSDLAEWRAERDAAVPCADASPPAPARAAGLR